MSMQHGTTIIIRHLTHSEACLKLQSQHFRGECLHFSSFTSCRSEYNKAESLQKSALDILEKSLPSVHPKLGQAVFDLAKIFLYQVIVVLSSLIMEGKYDMSESHYQRSLEIRQNVYTSNPSHPDIADSLAGTTSYNTTLMCEAWDTCLPHQECTNPQQSITNVHWISVSLNQIQTSEVLANI